MSSTLPRTLAIAAALILAVVASGREASAQPKPKAKSACGIRLLPLTVGNKWTFVQMKPPAEPDEGQKRYIPVQPTQVTIEVKDITDAGGKSVVKLEETIDDRKLNTTITCGPGVFEVSPDSFLFAGEPGGFYNIELGAATRVLKDTDAGPSKPWADIWREDITLGWKRVPEQGMTIDLGEGTVEIEHIYKLGRPETVNPQYKAGLTARRLTIELSGRVAIKGVDRKSEMPAATNAIWFVDGMGPVQVTNGYYQAYQLADVVLVK
jgi:hypothetical protein